MVRGVLHDNSSHIRAYKARHTVFPAQYVSQNLMVGNYGLSIDGIVGAHRVGRFPLDKCLLKYRHTVGEHVMAPHSRRRTV